MYTDHLTNVVSVIRWLSAYWLLRSGLDETDNIKQTYVT